MCVGYDLNGKILDYLPATSDEQFNIKPYIKLLVGNLRPKVSEILKILPKMQKNIYIH